MRRIAAGGVAQLNMAAVRVQVDVYHLRVAGQRAIQIAQVFQPRDSHHAASNADGLPADRLHRSRGRSHRVDSVALTAVLPIVETLRG